jgi:hypothetical protein
MSVAGILASNLFSNAISTLTQGSQPSVSQLGSGAHVSFADVQKFLSALGSSSTTSSPSVPAKLAQLGQDLQSGNLPAAQTDFSLLQNGLPLGLQAQLNLSLHPANGTSGSPAPVSLPSNQSGGVSNQMTMAMKVYGALQQGLTNNSQGTSLLL